MSLKEYKAKRNFLKTKEPVGRSRVDHHASNPLFVIQKHAATRLHYDFRLEMDGVLKSWAVPKGFPVKRGDRRLAVEVEDHPIDYGSFEGTIPEGNYGAGTVMLWDRGTYSVFGADSLDAVKSGKIHFVLNGKKLRGEWTLVRMRHFEGNKPQWLLLKSGEDVPPFSARADDQSVLTKRSMSEIAHARSRNEWTSNRVERSRSGPGVARESITSSRSASFKPRQSSVAHVSDSLSGLKSTKARPNSSRQSVAPLASAEIDLRSLPSRKPVFVEPMKALLVTKLPKGSEWVYEIKFDGVRALAIKDGRSLDLVSRAGNGLGAKYPEILDGLKNLSAKQAVLDGEIVAVDQRGRSEFQLLQSYQSSGHAKPPLFYYVFDLLELNGKDLCGLPLWQRKALAQELTRDMFASVRFSGTIEADSQKLIKEMKGRGLEGLIGKKTDSKYEPGRRSGAWVKFKWTSEQEFVVGGFTRPKGGRSHFGAILVGCYQNKRLLFAAKVGTGFNEQTLESLHAKFKKLEQSECPFVNLPERRSGLAGGLGPAEMLRCTWLKPELVCQVRFAEWTRDNHLRQPAFLGLREDKNAQEVVREKPA